MGLVRFLGRTVWVLRHLIEVDNAIERATAANPGVDGEMYWTTIRFPHKKDRPP